MQVYSLYALYHQLKLVTWFLYTYTSTTNRVQAVLVTYRSSWERGPWETMCQILSIGHRFCLEI